MGDREDQAIIPADIKGNVGNKVNPKGELLNLSQRWRERSRGTVTTIDELKPEQEGKNEILGVTMGSR
jgi:hypothetical protein